MAKDLEYYLSLPYTIVLKPYPDGEYFARVEELPGCMTEGRSLAEVMEMIEDAKAGWLELALEDGDVILEPSVEQQPKQDYNGKFSLRLPSSLHRKLAEQARREGVSLDQFVNMALAEAVGRKAA